MPPHTRRTFLGQLAATTLAAAVPGAIPATAGEGEKRTQTAAAGASAAKRKPNVLFLDVRRHARGTWLLRLDVQRPHSPPRRPGEGRRPLRPQLLPVPALQSVARLPAHRQESHPYQRPGQSNRLPRGPSGLDDLAPAFPAKRLRHGSFRQDLSRRHRRRQVLGCHERRWRDHRRRQRRPGRQDLVRPPRRFRRLPASCRRSRPIRAVLPIPIASSSSRAMARPTATI